MQLATETVSVTPTADFTAPETAAAPGTAVRRIQDHPPQRRRGRVRAAQDLDRDDQGFPRRERRHRRGFGARARAGRAADRSGRPGARAPPAFGRHVPHRGHPGPGRARAHARRRAQRRPRLRALPRGARAGARQAAREAAAAVREARPALNVTENGVVAAARRGEDHGARRRPRAKASAAT